jgi:hypothetical protein
MWRLRIAVQHFERVRNVTRVVWPQLRRQLQCDAQEGRAQLGNKLFQGEVGFVLRVEAPVKAGLVRGPVDGLAGAPRNSRSRHGSTRLAAIACSRAQRRKRHDRHRAERNPPRR